MIVKVEDLRIVLIVMISEKLRSYENEKLEKSERRCV